MSDVVTNLSQRVLDFIKIARMKPALASDPSELDNLENAALTSAQGAYAALTAPAADDTWEARTLFLGSQAMSERIVVDVPFPTMFIGAYASLSIFASGGATVPTLDDIDVTVDVNLSMYKTNAQGTTTPTVAGQLVKDGTFVTLASMSTSRTAGGRLFNWVLPYSSAQLGVTYRWKQGAGVFKDSHVGLAFFVKRVG
jgi:hypothetical protein